MSSPEAQKVLHDRETVVENRAHNDLLWVLSTSAGRRFVWDLLDTAGIVAPSFAADPLATAYNEGRRSVGLGLLYRVQSEAPEKYAEAFTEHVAEQKAEALAQEAARTAAAAPEEM